MVCTFSPVDTVEFAGYFLPFSGFPAQWAVNTLEQDLELDPRMTCPFWEDSWWFAAASIVTRLRAGGGGVATGKPFQGNDTDLWANSALINALPGLILILDA
eukprot:GABV01005671.1.p1 GENE.GABV01005671.1~~GABV01005671.1.p1  ORF type:complete len:102 (-),score=20.74 GABV01005671.1:3-308(-)